MESTTVSAPRRRFAPAVLVTVVAALLASSTAAAADPAVEEGEEAIRQPVETQQVLVELDDLGLPDDADRLAQLFGLLLDGDVEPTVASAELDVVAADVTEDGLRTLRRVDVVRRVEPLPELELSLDVSVPTVEASDLHLDGRTGEGKAVVVIDTGVAAGLPGVDLVAEACFVPEWVEGDPGPNPCPVRNGEPGAAAPCEGLPDACAHGSHIASIITAGGGAFTGVAPDADVIAIRVTDDAADISEVGVLQALLHVVALAETHDIAAVNLSLGGAAGDCSFPLWEDVISELTDAGIAVVAASGNLEEFESWGEVPVDFPACLPAVVSVGSTTEAGEVADFTQSVPSLDLLAPGECIDSDVFDDDPGLCPLTSGTSFATPHVAAAFALLDGAQPGFDVARSRDLLRTTGEWITRPTVDTEDRDPRYSEIRLAEFVDFVPFADALAGLYWSTASDWAKHTGVSGGLDGVVFGAGGTLDRAQAVTLLWRFMGSPTGYPPSGFVDVPAGSFFELAVDWAKATGVTSGTTALTFSPGDEVTRAQVAAFLWRLVGSPVVGHDGEFVDVLWWEYFADAVDWMDLHGITTGTQPGYFSPTWPIDRGQIITFLYRLARAAGAWSGGVSPPGVVQF